MRYCVNSLSLTYNQGDEGDLTAKWEAGGTDAAAEG
jgi:hypothetical protein